MSVQIVVSHVKYAARNVGAVIGSALKVCQNIRPHKAHFNAAFTLLHTPYVPVAQLVAETVNNLLKRLDLSCRGGVVVFKSGKRTVKYLGYRTAYN